VSVLTIYTNKFPYGKGETFLESEIKYLSHNFVEIFIIPFQVNGEARSVPGNVSVLSPIQDRKWPRLKIYWAGISSCYLLYKIPELRDKLKSISVFKSIKYLGYAILTKNSPLKIIPTKFSIHYSYWLNFSAFSLALLKMEEKIDILISRAHGFDLYEERGEKGLIFIKAATLKNMDKLFLISKHGQKYILNKYPEFSEKYLLSYLGTSDPGFLNPLPGITDFTILSCSVINPNKRINLIEESLICFNKSYPAIKVKWYHLGGGPGINIFRERAAVTFKNSSIQCFFPGQMTPAEIFEVYKSIPVSLFINVSESEGLPVSIMEAQSCGIPVIATGVGGTPEIVNSENGFLLPANPAPMEIADLMYNVHRNPEKWQEKRAKSRESWETKFRAESNYNEFGLTISSLVAESQM